MGLLNIFDSETLKMLRRIDMLTVILKITLLPLIIVSRGMLYSKFMSKMNCIFGAKDLARIYLFLFSL